MKKINISHLQNLHTINGWVNPLLTYIQILITKIKIFIRRRIMYQRKNVKFRNNYKSLHFSSHKTSNIHIDD